MYAAKCLKVEKSSQFAKYLHNAKYQHVAKCLYTAKFLHLQKLTCCRISPITNYLHFNVATFLSNDKYFHVENVSIFLI